MGIRYRIYDTRDSERMVDNNPNRKEIVEVNGDIIDAGNVPKTGVVEFDSGDVKVHSVQFHTGEPESEVALGHIEVGKKGKISVDLADLPAGVKADSETVVTAAGTAEGAGSGG
jgi:hypothetical protein